MDIFHPARNDKIRIFEYHARRVRRPPAPLTKSFAAAAKGAMANRGGLNRPLKRRLKEWRSEDWMEEDDLLGEEMDL